MNKKTADRLIRNGWDPKLVASFCEIKNPKNGRYIIQIFSHKSNGDNTKEAYKNSVLNDWLDSIRFNFWTEILPALDVYKGQYYQLIDTQAEDIEDSVLGSGIVDRAAVWRNYGDSLTDEVFLSQKRSGRIPYNHKVTINDFCGDRICVSPGGYALTEEEFIEILRPYSKEDEDYSMDDESYRYLRNWISTWNLHRVTECVKNHAKRHKLLNPKVCACYKNKEDFYEDWMDIGYTKKEAEKIFQTGKNEFLVLPDNLGIIRFVL